MLRRTRRARRRLIRRSSDWRERLAVGDLRFVGEANAVASELAAAPSRSGELVTLLFDLDRAVRMRAADALEKASVAARELLQDHEQRLLACAERALDPELRWHLARMLTRIALSVDERDRTVELLRLWLSDRSVIVRAESLEALAILADGDAELEYEATVLLRRVAAGGRPAEKARARRLLRERRLPETGDQIVDA